MRLLSRRLSRTYPGFVLNEDVAPPADWTRPYGWHHSRPSLLDVPADPSGIKILTEVDPRGDMAAPYDQLPLGACTANAVSGAIQYDTTLTTGTEAPCPSRLDIYYGERAYEGTTATDAGAFGRDGFKYAQHFGWIPETDWPYDITKFAIRPPLDPTDRHKIGPYKSVARTKGAWRRVLSNRQTIAFGFTVYSSFESAEVARTGVVPVPQPGEQELGGHEVLAVGYLKAEPEYVLCRNSWGTSWGDGGYFLMPWEVILNPNLSSDFRTIYRPAGK